MGVLVSVDEAKATERRMPNGGVIISIPIRMRMRGGRKAIIMPEGANMATGIPEHEATAIALVRAHCWYNKLQSGRFKSVPELAAAVNRERSYVSRILELVNLAPDIALVLLDGNEPEGLTLKKLRQGIPVLWEEQRERLGITIQTDPALAANTEGV